AAAAFERLPELVGQDAWLAHRGRHLTADCLIEIGAVPFHASIAAGRLVSLERGQRLMRPWRFAVRGEAAAWLRFWRPLPEPGWHDLMALAKRGEARLEGDLLPLMANLQYFKDLLAAPRRLFAEA
ncbi:MAG: hypothetical protein ACHQF3_17700, partial [Alphaproteobacteria bacterium]